ncbi:ubl carboxyl-terminal hydrolase 18-like [Oncorhynchus clarkii lewisi]|uniref:ubl carboxyl-terminal hydrolase 18-like n=1 Tax=Oncorhynchus clarkii lewisi TaxID=490388 RepID=UPI0039B84B24
MRGLINHGTYCSINSVVQVLYGTSELRDLIRLVDHRSPNRVALKLKRLIYDMTKGNPSPCDPNLLVDAMTSYRGAPFDVQEDSDVVFKCIINALADDCGIAKRIGSLWDIENEDRVRCLRCNTVQSTLNKSNTITVLIGAHLPTELQDYIKMYTDNTFATCDYHCTHCHTGTQIEITSKVLTLPQVVCMRIERVRNIGRDTADIVKTGTRCAFPETLDLKYIMKEPEATVDTVYKLYAVLAHSGSHYCGHYTAYVRDDDIWYFADDSHVRVCSWEDVKSTYEAGSMLCNGVAYMLMYRKQHSRTPCDTNEGSVHM